jgi:hypothetical protein
MAVNANSLETLIQIIAIKIQVIIFTTRYR